MTVQGAYVHIDRLSKRYGNVVAIDNVSLTIERGEFITFLGPSGSGKTTTLSILAGFTDQTEGEIFVEGRPLTSVPPHKRNIGMVFQRYTLFPHMTVAENVAFPLSVRGLNKADTKVAVNRALDLVRLSELASRRPADLSGGQQQRVALARALVYQPRILLMDEPLSALDKKLREEIQIELRQLHHELDVTIVYVTHDQEEALRLSDRIAVFDRGGIVQVGAGEELYEAPGSEFVAGFIGSSNFLDGEVAGAEADRIAIRIPGGGTVLTDRAAGSMKNGSGVRVMVRPERLALSRGRSVEGGNSISGIVADATYLGDVIHYEVETASGHRLSARATSSGAFEKFEPGAEVIMTLAPRDLHVFPSAVR